jgi:hypothetical protein
MQSKLDTHLPIIRGNLRHVAVSQVIPGYNLGCLSQEGISALMRDMKYVYPPSLNISHIESILVSSTSHRVMVLLA